MFGDGKYSTHSIRTVHVGLVRVWGMEISKTEADGINILVLCVASNRFIDLLLPFSVLLASGAVIFPSQRRLHDNLPSVNIVITFLL